MSAIVQERRETLDSVEYASRVGTTAWTVRKAVREDGHFLGVVPIRVGRRILWPKAAVDRVLEGEVVEIPNEAA